MPSLSSPFVASPRPAGRGEAPNYTASLNLKVKVLDFVKSGGRGWNRTAIVVPLVHFS